MLFYLFFAILSADFILKKKKVVNRWQNGTEHVQRGDDALEIKFFNIGGTVVNNYLLETPNGVIAIDTGYPGGMERFKARFEKRWPLSRLKYIFLTHHHDDHAGFLGDLLKETDAEVVLHPLAVHALEAGKSSEPAGAGYSSVPASLFSIVKKDFSFPPVTVGSRSIIVNSESDQVFESMGLPIRILFLPGHTADSMGLFLPDSGRLFCGDAAMNMPISVARHTIWIEDAAEFSRSWDKMLALNPVKIYPSHGRPFSPKDLLKYRHFMDGRKLIQPRK